VLDLIEAFDGSPSARRHVLDGVQQHVAAVVASRKRGDLAAVARAEAEVAPDPLRYIHFDKQGDATVQTGGRAFAGGRFELLSLAALQVRAREARERAGRPSPRARLWLLDGVSPATDIGALQATAPPRSLFQVASQFNCLESPGAFVTPVANYAHDPTQGPRASLSAWPGTLVRHYAAPAADGSRFVQTTNGPQIDLLADVCDPGVASVRNGYLRAENIDQMAAFAQALESRFDAIRVGVHDGVQVVLGYDWDGAVEGTQRTTAQVFTSTIAAGMYGDLDERDDAAMTVCRQLQRAAYLGTLLAAAALGHERVVLTLIGGGVFANPIGVIWNAIGWALDRIPEFLHRDLCVIVNGRTLREQLSAPELLAAVRAHAGGILRLSRTEPPQLDA
jgi:hypothetical protein